MPEEPNLRLDVETPREAAGPVMRVRLDFARGYASDGAPTITRDCSSVRALEREIRRLNEELGSALAEARRSTGDTGETGQADPETTAPTAEERPSLASDLRVEQVMTRDVHTVERNEKIAVAEELMRAGRFRHIVVVDDEGLLAGVVSQRDIVFSALSWQLGQGSNAHRRALESVLAKELMQTQVVTIAPNEPISLAAQRMTEHKVGCLPVVDGADLVGIVTEGDFLSLLAG